jgi:hypothetical protein
MSYTDLQNLHLHWFNLPYFHRFRRSGRLRRQEVYLICRLDAQVSIADPRRIIQFYSEVHDHFIIICQRMNQ